MTKSDHLFSLIRNGDIEEFQAEADKCSELRVLGDRWGNSILHRAARRGTSETCRYLVKRGISVTAQGDGGATPMHAAAARGDRSIMETLLESASTLSPINAKGITPIHIAAGSGQTDILELLLDRGAPADTGDKYGRQAVHFASGANQLQVMKILAEYDPQCLEAPDYFAQRPLHWTLAYERAEATHWLLERDKPIEMFPRDIYGRSPLFFANLTKNESITSRLKESIRSGQEQPFEKYSPPPLHATVQCGDIESAHELLEGGVDINDKDSLGRTALHIAAFEQKRGMYDWLREHHADDRIRDDYAWTPLTLLSYRSIKPNCQD